jgi:hypothetical protein
MGMIDREKVIDYLEYHIHLLYDVIPHVSRDDGEYLEAAAKTMSDAITLMKAQEPIDGDTISRSALLAAYDAAHKGPPGGARKLIEEAPAVVLKAQEPRVLSAADVAACPNGTVLWVEERQGVTWNMFPLEIYVSSTHPDGTANADYDYYGKTWRCWTSRPTDEQREAAAWE